MADRHLEELQELQEEGVTGVAGVQELQNGVPVFLYMMAQTNGIDKGLTQTR